jgi:hypothetical protein
MLQKIPVLSSHTTPQLPSLVLPLRTHNPLLIRLHQQVTLHLLNEPLIRSTMTPRLQPLFLTHGIREAAGPLIARESSNDIFDGGLGNQVWVGA